jgi:type IV secretion system protein VirB9
MQPARADDSGGPIRSVKVSEKVAIPITTRILHQTMIILPEGEKVVNVYCGDCGPDGNWIVAVSKTSPRFLDVKSSKADSSTDLNLITDHQHTYTLRVSEIGKRSGAADEKVFLVAASEELQAENSKPPEFVPATDVERYKQQAEAAKAETETAKKQAQEQIAQETERFRVSLVKQMRFEYSYDVRRAPFHVTAIWHDDKFTYIKAAPQEAPALYEVKENKPSLLNYSFDSGVYTVPKILDRGYLAVGKRKMVFQREGAP